MTSVESPAPLLEVAALDTHYGQFRALANINMTLAPGACAAIVGANGAGKSTLLQSIIGSQAKSHGIVRFRGEDITGLTADRIVKKGIAIVPEGRRLFPSLTVEENLLMGVDVGRRGAYSLDKIYARFPRLQERKGHLAPLLSGGEQQMVAIGRALLTNPTLLLCDELSLGLAPVMVQEIYVALTALRAEGVAILFVEQDLGLAMAHADYLYCMREGEVVLEGRANALDRGAIKTAYFGLHHA